LWLSAVRSRLFNEVLAERERLGLWNALMEGDVLQPEGSRGLFLAEDEPQAVERVATGEVHPTAPLPGIGGMASSGACAELERRVLAPYQDLVEALCREGVEASRRATRLPVTALEWRHDGDALILSFSLPAGAFATTVLANFLDWTEYVADRQ
jgi:tRNA pseudouridine13 synthase